MEKELDTTQPAGERPVCYAAADERDEAEWIATRIGALVVRGRCLYEDVGVLFRTNVQARSIEEALVRHNIPYRVRSGPRFYELPEIRLLSAILRLVIDESDSAAATYLLGRVPGIGERRLAQIEQLAAERGCLLRDLIAAGELPLPATVRESVARLRETLRGIEALRRGPVTAVVEASIALARRLLPEVQHAGMPGDDPLEEVRSMLEEHDPRALSVQGLVDRLTLLGPAGGQSGVSLLTLHAAKGLEFFSVFLAGMEEGLLPHRRSADAPSTLEEERRLCYVGMTRAKRLLFISYARMRLLGGHAILGGASRFVGEIGPANIVFRSSPTLKHRPRLAHVRPGERVVHPRWRAGTVVRVEGQGRETMVTIDFGSRGTQRVQLCHAPLERLSEEGEHVAVR
jgi:DNA helicase-2/ATP-dependent DNA helicase PcrA